MPRVHYVWREMDGCLLEIQKEKLENGILMSQRRALSSVAYHSVSLNILIGLI